MNVTSSFTTYLFQYLESSTYLKTNLSKVEEIQRDVTVCRYLFTAKLLYMFRAYIGKKYIKL